jgi:hypothetical protein
MPSSSRSMPSSSRSTPSFSRSPSYMWGCASLCEAVQVCICVYCYMYSYINYCYSTGVCTPILLLYVLLYFTAIRTPTLITATPLEYCKQYKQPVQSYTTKLICFNWKNHYIPHFIMYRTLDMSNISLERCKGNHPLSIMRTRKSPM